MISKDDAAALGKLRVVGLKRSCAVCWRRSLTACQRRERSENRTEAERHVLRRPIDRIRLDICLHPYRRVDRSRIATVP
jgi:hypothetical protein